MATATSTTVTVNATTIREGAFSELIRNAAGDSQNIDLVIFIEGSVTIEAAAFQQSQIQGITLNSASITFAPGAIVTLGADAFAGLPVQSLVLPAATTLQANALRSLDNLRLLDISAVTTNMVTNSLNLTRPTATPLILSMPASTSVSYAEGSIVIPPTSATNNNTTTILFNGPAVPSNAFTPMSAATNTGAIQIALNPSTTTQQLTDITLAPILTALTPVDASTIRPVTATFSNVQAAIVAAIAQTSTTPVAPGATLVSLTQFESEHFDTLVIAPNVPSTIAIPNLNAINQCVIVGLTESARTLNANIMRIPNVITLPDPADTTKNITHSVINLTSRMSLSNDQTLFIMDNYHDPSDVALANIDVPLVAIFSRRNATNAAFKPALVCNGTIRNNPDGSVTVSGSKNDHCQGHTAAGSSTAVSLLGLNQNTALYDANASTTDASIATITFPTNATFVVQFNPVSPMRGCFENYSPVGGMMVHFTNVASASGAASNTFTSNVATLVANNNALTTLLTQIKNESITPLSTAPVPVVSISSELTALSKSDFHSVLSAWRSLRTKHNGAGGYKAYLTNVVAYVDNVILNSPDKPIINAKFTEFKPLLAAAILLVSGPLTDVITGATTGAGPFYAATVLPYFRTRFSIGLQSFKGCTTLANVINFNLLRNISKINDEIFCNCGTLASPANIPINVVSIGVRAYQNCIKVQSIDIQEAFALRTIGESAFEACLVMEGNLSFSSSIGFDESVETIGDKAFSGCAKLTDHLYFPPTLTSLGVSAFEGCAGLNGTIVFPRNASFTVIPDRAFANCTGITGISTNTGNGTSLEYLASIGSGRIPNGLIIPAQVTRIGREAFLNCSKFALALDLNTTPNPNPNPTTVTPRLPLIIEQIGNAAFSGCAAFTSLVLPSLPSYTVVADECFNGCSGIMNLTIPTNVTTIQESAFSGCNKIANVPKFDNVTSIGSNAFNGCIGMIGALVLGTNLEILGDRAFFDCRFLTSATFLGSPPLGVSASRMIFGLTAASPTTFHVNVFTENAWNGNETSMITSPVFKINDVFRAITTPAAPATAQSVVNMAFIEFNTYLPSSPTSRDLTISNFKSFNVYDNTGTAGANLKLVPQNDAGFSWNDVYIPGTLKGINFGNADANNKQRVTLQRQVTALITPNVSATQTRAVDLAFSTAEALREFDGRHMAVVTGEAGAPLTLAALTTSGQALATAGYGIFTNNSKDYLYYYAGGGETSSKLVSSRTSDNVSYFVNKSDVPNYANKLISVGAVGEIFVSNVTPIGYDAPTAVTHSATVPTTLLNLAYTIFASGPSVKDKLYFGAIIAPAGAYFISNVNGEPSNEVTANYNRTVIHVQQDGSIDIPVRQLKNNFKIILSVGNDPNVPGYSFTTTTDPQLDANTDQRLMFKAAAGAAVAAAPGYYFVQSTTPVSRFNNVMILVLPTGGVSTASFGALGSINKLDKYATAISTEPIPLYNDNVAVTHFNHYMNEILPLNHNNYSDAMTDFDAKLVTFQAQQSALNTQVSSSSMKNAINSIGTVGPAFINSVSSLNATVATANTANATLGNDVSAYNNLVIGLNNAISGTADDSLKSIQAKTMSDITAFQRSCTFNSDPNATANNINYITTQIDAFVTAILVKQHAQKSSVDAYVSTTITSVKNNVSFVVSPTNVSPAPSGLYADLSIQQKILFDFTESFISQWLNSGNVWTAVNDMASPTEAQLLNWAKDNIFPVFDHTNTPIYQQFLTNNVVPSLAHVRTSVSAYEFGSNNTAARSAYQGAVLVKVLDVPGNFNSETSTDPPTAPAVNGALRFNAGATKIFISLKNSATTPVTVSFNRFADTIALNNGSIIFTIKSVKTDAVCHTLDVAHVSGPTTVTSAAITFYTYQAVSPLALTRLDAMNTAVRTQYYQPYAGVAGVNAATGIKARILAIKTALQNNQVIVASSLLLMSNSVATLYQNINVVNTQENALIAYLQSQSGDGTNALNLAGAQMLVRELQLFGSALADQAAAPGTTLPGPASLPEYEINWFNQRVAAFWNDQKPNVGPRADLYNPANTAFQAARFARQTAAIDLYIATTPPGQTMVAPTTTQFASEQARAMMQTMPAYIVTSDRDALAKLISTRLLTYIIARDAAVTGATDRPAKVAEFAQKKTVEFTQIMNTINSEYGKVAHTRYLRVIDLAISTAFYANAQAGQTNLFNTLMQRWNSASNKSDIFNQIKPLLFEFVYTTNNTVYSSTDFPLKAGVENISWFGAPIPTVMDVKRDGFLYTIINNGWQFVKDAYDSLNGIPFTAYVTTVSGVTTNGSLPLTNPPPPPPNLATFSTSLANNNPLALPLAAVAALTSSLTASPLSYNIVGIGYASLASAEATSAGLATLGFTNVTGTGTGTEGLNFQIESIENNLRYKFTRNGNWYHGYQQSSNLINSWTKLSPAQNAVMFYAGTATDAPAANLLASSQSSVTALCDNAAFVMIIEDIAGSTTKSVSLYTYGVMGLSGDLVAVGKLAPAIGPATGFVPTLYSVNGAFQKSAANKNITLVGDLVIPSSIKTIGINAFAMSSRIKSFVFGAGAAGSVSIGSNAFQECTALSTLNLGSTVGSIGPSAFLKCTGANSLVLPPANFTVVNHWSFLGCSKLSTSGNLVLPAALQQINVQAFANCPLLTCPQLNGSFPPALQKFGIGAFLGCTGLTGALNFNNVNNAGASISSIAFIGSAAFMGCTGLNGTLDLPINNDYKNVLPYVFSSIDALIFSVSGVVYSVPRPGSATSLPMALTGAVDVTNTKITTIETRAFHMCAALNRLTLTNLVTKVGAQSFLNCSSLSGTLNIPASVLNVHEQAFMGCSRLTGLNIISATVSSDNAGSGTAIGPKCFSNCTALVGSTATSGLVIPNNVISMGDSAFEQCTSIESITVGSGFTQAGSFGANLFTGCTKLARVVLAFSFLSSTGPPVVKNTTQTTPPTPLNSSFTGCTALGVLGDITPTGTVQIQSGATGWTPGRAAFFNNLTIVVNNRNITFYLKEFNRNISVVDPAKDPVQLEALPVTDAQAIVYVKASDMRRVFQVSTDSYVNPAEGDTPPSNSDPQKLFFVRPEVFPQYLNVANAHVVQGGIESYNSKTYEQLVKDDVMRYYATSLFNSADWVTLFSNDVEMMENMVASSGLMPIVPNGETDATGRHLVNEGVLNKIMAELNRIAYNRPPGPLVPPNATGIITPQLVKSRHPAAETTKWSALPDSVTPDQGNIGMKLFNIINRNDPGRITSMNLNGSIPTGLPFLPGDQFIFVFTLNENEVQLAADLPKVTVKQRTYMIRLALTDDFASGSSLFANHNVALYAPSPINLNVLPVSGAYVADYMYSNYDLHMAIKPSLLIQHEASVYNRITGGTHEPVRTPPNLLPFTGWYYNYQHSTQSIRLNFTPSDISLTNVYRYSDLRYLSAYIYFPTAWPSQTALPNATNFPQWVLTFTGGAEPITVSYRAQFLTTAGVDTVNFLGETVPFDFTNTHVQLICPFDNNVDVLPLLAGKLANGTPGSVNVITGTHIFRQRNAAETVSGLRKPTSNTGPFTYPPIARGYQGINMITTLTSADLALLKPDTGTSAYSLTSITLDINMTNNDGFVPSIIMKSVEVVAKKYESYYLAPLDPN
jgi:hypothetical protein